MKKIGIFIATGIIAVSLIGKASAMVSYSSIDGRMDAIENRITALEQNRYQSGSCADLSVRMSADEQRITVIEKALSLIQNQIMSVLGTILSLLKAN